MSSCLRAEQLRNAFAWCARKPLPLAIPETTPYLWPILNKTDDGQLLAGIINLSTDTYSEFSILWGYDIAPDRIQHLDYDGNFKDIKFNLSDTQPNMIRIKLVSPVKPMDLIVLLLDAAEQRKNELSVFTGNELSCVSYGELGYKGFLLSSACFTGFIAGKILEFVQTDRIKYAQELQDYMNSLLIDVFGLDFEHYLIGQKQMMVELGIFNTAKTFQDSPISEEFINTIKELVKEKKDCLMPEIKQIKQK